MTDPNQPPWQQPPYQGQPNQGQHYQGQPYPVQAQQPKQKSWPRRHKFLTGLGALVVLIVVGSAIGSSGGNGSNDTASSVGGAPTAGAGVGSEQPKEKKAEEKKDTVAKVGTPVRDGKFQFTVTKVRCGVPSVGPQDFGQTAQGQFCLVTLKVENIGDKPQTLDASSQEGYDQAGHKLDADASAGIYANPAGGGAFLNDINPGNALTAVVVYDIPKTGKLTRLELHDSPFSGGVTVQL